MSSKCLLCGVNDYERWRWPCCSWCAYEVEDDDLNKIEADVLNALGDIKPTFAVWEENTKNLDLREPQPAKVSPDLSLYIGEAARIPFIATNAILAIIAIIAHSPNSRHSLKTAPDILGLHRMGWDGVGGWAGARFEPLESSRLDSSG